jgi:hypothetical protein
MEDDHTMKHQAFRPVAVMLSFLLVVAGASPARAGNIQFADVVQAIADGQAGRSRVELRLRAVSQSGRVNATTTTTTQQASSGDKGSTSTESPNDTSNASSANMTQTSVESAQGGVTGQVETIDLGDVTGTVCDCGEIPKGGFPKWPLLALGAIPFFFIPNDKCEGDCIPPPCIGDCNPPQIPEPATLLLFGSGMLALGAGARRRRAARRQESANTPEEV